MTHRPLHKVAQWWEKPSFGVRQVRQVQPVQPWSHHLGGLDQTSLSEPWFPQVHASDAVRVRPAPVKPSCFAHTHLARTCGGWEPLSWAPGEVLLELRV